MKNNRTQDKIHRAAIRPLIAVLCSSIILMIVFCTLISAEINRMKEKEINRVTHDYVHFYNHIQGFFTDNINLMTGFSAYIQTFEQYDDKEISDYLANLTRNNAFYIRDIGIIQDTTIKWIYPLEGNEKALGTDLSKVKDQAPSIRYVKTNLTNHFDGPRQLVQGGTGYIIRIPILKDNTYWGIASVVLDDKKVRDLFTEYEKECHLKVAILNKSADNKLFFGDPSVVSDDNLSFSSQFSGNEWMIYVVSTEPGFINWNYIILLSIVGVIAGIFVSRFVYRYMSETERVKARNVMLNQAVYRDRLTGLYNRSFFDVRLHEEIDAANRYKTTFSIIYFDLDHFKDVNDQYGHSYGDKVLVKISESVGQFIRSCDVLARWGGEEFVILMPETLLNGALSAAEKVRNQIESIEHPLVGKVTASFGVAEYYPDEYMGSLLKRVDSALYRAKAEGRNRVVYSEPSTCVVGIQHRIGWKEDWRSGNNTIDLDHLELLRLGNQLVEDSYTIYTYEEAVSRYNEVLDHIAAHFDQEEKILAAAGFGGLEEHKKAHQELLESAVAFRENLKEDKINAQQFFNYLMKELIVCHLTEEDVKYFALLRLKTS
jgi:diguanylate cyclase (GGDEF)-like protein/hemerythrin-like metal-binding protein